MHEGVNEEELKVVWGHVPVPADIPYLEYKALSALVPILLELVLTMNHHN